MKRLTVGIHALHCFVLYLCTLNKSKLTRAASLTLASIHTLYSLLILLFVIFLSFPYHFHLRCKAVTFVIINNCAFVRAAILSGQAKLSLLWSKPFVQQQLSSKLQLERSRMLTLC